MTELLLSTAERAFIVHGIEVDYRTDGRGREDFRETEIETNLNPNSAGSARLKLANTDVTVGVKAEIGRPLANRPNEGRIEFALYCSAVAAPVFEGRGGESLSTMIVSALSSAYGFDQCLDLADLCLVPKEKCWILNVDIVLMQIGGNLFDSVALAVKAALYNTRIPKLTVGCGEQGAIDLEIPDDPYDCLQLNMESAPCLVTVSKVGECEVVDATMEEETCATASLVVGVREDGMITTVKKYGSMSLNTSSIHEMTEMAKRVGMQLNRSLKLALRMEEEKRNKKIAANEPTEDLEAGFLR